MESYRERTEYQRQHYIKNRARKLAYRKEYASKHKEEILKKQRECGKKWFLNNKDRVYAYRNNKYKNDIQFKISEVLRKRLKHLIKAKDKKHNAIELLGCTIDFFKGYISTQFKEGMSWDNHGRSGWHIDHIKPCASFDLTKEEDQKKCFHYTNMQPLWAVDNLKKGAK